MLNSQQTFYNKTVKNAVIAFGNLFNNIYLQRYDQSGVMERRIRVPISYAPKEKFLARMQQQPNVDEQREELTLPRLAFQIVGIQYDPTRQMNNMQGYRTMMNGTTNSAFNPVPYNLKFALFAVAKTQEDALMIMEQILPTFTPTYTLKMNQMPTLGLTTDLPFVLDGVDIEDNFADGKFEDRRQVIISFEFTVQLNFFGYVDTSRGIIKQTEVSIYGQSTMTPDTETEAINVSVVPLTANPGDTYDVVTVIQGFNDND